MNRKSKLENRNPKVENRNSKIEIRKSPSGHRFSSFQFRVSKPWALKISLGHLILLAVAASAAAGAEHRDAAHRQSERAAAQAALAEARQRVQGASPLAMFYYADDSLGLASLQAHADAITLLAPQCYGLDRAGALHGQLPAGVLDVARHASLPLMPLVTNSGFDRLAAHRLLHNVQAQERAARSLAQLAERDQYVGWQLDFENIAPADKLAYTRFVARVAARLHHDHRLLSVAVVARFSDRYPDSSGPGFHTGEWGAAFDYRGLARVADFLVLMAYDQHTPSTPPGPVAGYDWVKAALDYALRRVPASKLLLGIPLYGREWAETARATTSHSLAYKDLEHFLEDPASERHWDDILRTTWLQLREGETLRTAWFDDARSLREKLKLTQLYHLRGYAAWRLGVEDPGFWQGSDDP
ncbi:MAG TPA: glycosyl hydrolase family 18 protein [Terriglobia bacterium]|nr:glycosyl hydrolase family 18 protein [Terriglobia bacterium]